MSSLEARVQQCFATAFPDLPSAEISGAVLDSTPQWDSVATVILIIVLEEEFGIQIDPANVARLTSYVSIVDYLQVRTEGVKIVRQ
jgi:acyl carrier protein